MDASEVAVRVRLLGGTQFERDAKGVAGSVEDIGAAGKKTNLSGTVGADAANAGSAIASFGSKVGKAGSTLMGVGRSLAPAAAGIAGIGYYAVKAQMSFQKSMMLLVTQARLPRRHIQALTKDIQALSKAVGQSPTALAEGAYPIVSSGVHNPKKIASLLRLAGVMAAVGGDTVDNTSSALTSILNTGFKGSPQKIAAMIEAAIGVGKMHMSDVTASMSTSILPLAKMVGGARSLPQILAAMASLTREGVPASSAMSRMRLSLTSVTSPTVEGIGALQQMGLGKFALANDLRGPGGLLSMLEDLKDHAARFGPNQRGNLIGEIFGKSRGIGNIGALLNSLPQMQRIFKAISGASPGLLASHFAETKTTSAFKMAQFKAAADVQMVKLGQTIQKVLLPDLLKLLPALTNAVGAFNKMSPGMQKFIVKMGAIIVLLSPFLFILGSILNVFKYLFDALGFLIEFVGGVIAGMSFLAAAAFVLISAIVIVAFIFRKQLWDAIKAVARFLANEFLWAVHSVVSHAKSLAHMFKSLADAAWKVIKFFGHIGGGLLHDATHPLSGIERFFSHIPGMYSGGIVQSGGMALVGERGPELLSLPRGASVSPLPANANTSLRTSNNDGGINMVVNTLLDGRVIATAVARVERNRQNRK